MATRRINHPRTGKPIDAQVVEIADIRETPTRVTLEDGTVLRLRIDVIEAIRIDGEWDADGHPMYQVRNGVNIMVLESPDHLKQSAASNRIQ